jgi:hypothetical protein
MAIPLHTFEPTGDPFVDDQQECRGEWPVYEDWFKENIRILRYTKTQIIEDSVEYILYGGPNPAPNEPGIYFLINGREIAYVGKAKNSPISYRLRDHFMRGKQFNRYWCFGGVPYDFIDGVEGFYIAKMKPYLNVAHVIYPGELDEVAGK